MTTTSVASSVIESDTFPDCWTVDQYAYFKRVNAWLVCNAGKLGCDICRRAGEVHNSVSVSAEWSDCSVVTYGNTTAKNQTSLRKKITSIETVMRTLPLKTFLRGIMQITLRKRQHGRQNSM